MMADALTAERRSWNMSRIRGRDTKPELQLRSLLHRSGYRFRLHDKLLPGKPDIVLRKYRAVILVHGCFWHRHPDCRNTTMPSTRREFWDQKFADTVERDRLNGDRLKELGWLVVTVWECELKRDPGKVLREISSQLQGRG